ncbi:malignant fibrous histiocytoma-amplified sequence 1 [Alligator mississippiensis]|uniref:Malignant fibrous histiocytoma-amplified sequence 1 n=1 Tax=Alligator mississippiensis TaxID=8496 RepID=A0A151MPY1_ALLMI|nr:malignant fibrous histiocytoma-amplified sequence 1 [Alligator mississippiensis]
MAETEPLKAARLLAAPAPAPPPAPEEPEEPPLEELEALNLGGRGLEELPEALGAALGHLRALAPMRELRKLGLSHNQLGMDGPGRLGELHQLEELDLSFNHLRRLPEGLGHLCQLRALDLRCLPEGIAALRRLKILWLSGTGLARLKMLNLSSNALGDSLCQLRQLRTLWLDNNRLRYLPDSIVQLHNLEELVLQGNQIAILPEGFGRLSRVTLWKIKDNPLIQPPYEVCMKGIPYIAAYQQELAHSQPALKPRLKQAKQQDVPLSPNPKVNGEAQVDPCPMLLQPDMLLAPVVASLPGSSKGIEVTDWTADAERGLTFIVYELAGDPTYDVIQSFFLSPGALYILAVNLSAYAPQRFYPSVGYFLHWLGAKVPHAVVCMVGTHADLCAERELEEKCLDIHHQIALQEKRDARDLQSLAHQVDEALGQDFDLRCSSPHAAFYGVSDKNLRRKKAQFQYLLNHRPQILSPVLPFSCQDRCQVRRLRDKLLSVAEHRDIFPNLHRVLPKSWQVLEELHFQPQAQQLWLSWWDSARLGLQAGLTEDRLQSALSYLHESGKLLYFEEHQTLREYVFHNLPRLIDILNVFCQRDATVLLQKMLSDTHIDELRAAQLHHYVEGFLLHGLLPAHIIRLLLKPHIQSQEDLRLILELLEKMGLCYCVNKPKCKPLNGATAWYKFPCYVKNEVPHAEAWINGTNLSGQSFVAEQLQIEYSFPFIFPPGLFARYSVQINNHVVQRSDGKYQIYAYRGKVPVVVSYRPGRGTLQPDTLSIASHASLPNIWTAWQAITPLMEELNVLLQEWPGLYYTVHVLCSKCLKRGSPNPHTFPGELLSQPRPEGVTEIICPKNGNERVNVALVYPPTPTVISPCSK